MQYCAEKFTVEPVEVFYEEGGERHVTPVMSSRREKASVTEICSVIGVEVRFPCD